MPNSTITELNAAKKILDAIAKSGEIPTDHTAYVMALGLADIANEVGDEDVAYEVNGISEMMFALSEQGINIEKPDARFLSRCIKHTLQTVA